MKLMITLLFLSVSFLLNAATVDTVAIYSNIMKKTRNCVVIRPAAYDEVKKSFPSVYLLHGYDGDYSNWIRKVPELKALSDLHQVLIICPDGETSSWYVDSSVDSSMQYENYIANEVRIYIDKHYRTIRDRKARAITGLSMGGHGAMLIAFENSQHFGACGSMSGVLDLSITRKKYELVKRIGDTLTQSENWKKFSMIHRIEKQPSDTLAIIIDCGVDDAFIGANRAIHEKMLRLNIPHEYIERPGGHSWNYWSNAVVYQLLYFSRYFDVFKKN